MARRAIELAIDFIAAKGSPDGGLNGFANNPNVPVLAATTGNWAVATPALIVADLNAAVQSIITTTKNVETPDTILLPSAPYINVAQQPYSIYSDKTILRWFLDSNPFIKNVDWWYQLDKANAAGTGPRMVIYRRDPEVLGLVIPQEFEQFEPERRNLEFKVPCHARIGGVRVSYPLAMVYVDGL